MTRKRTTAAVLAVAGVTAVDAHGGRASRERALGQTGSLVRSGEHVRRAARDAWTQSYNALVRSPTAGSAAAAASPRSRPASVDFGASDAPLTPDQFSGLPRLRPDSVGVLGHVDPVQRQRGRLRPQADGPDPRRDLPRHDQVLGQPGDQEDQPGDQAAAREDRPDLPQRRQRHELQLHRLPLARQHDVEEQGRQGHAAELPGRRRRTR